MTGMSKDVIAGGQVLPLRASIPTIRSLVKLVKGVEFRTDLCRKMPFVILASGSGFELTFVARNPRLARRVGYYLAGW